MLHILRYPLLVEPLWRPDTNQQTSYRCVWVWVPSLLIPDSVCFFFFLRHIDQQIVVIFRKDSLYRWIVINESNQTIIIGYGSGVENSSPDCCLGSRYNSGLVPGIEYRKEWLFPGSWLQCWTSCNIRVTVGIFWPLVEEEPEIYETTLSKG